MGPCKVNQVSLQCIVRYDISWLGIVFQVMSSWHCTVSSSSIVTNNWSASVYASLRWLCDRTPERSLPSRCSSICQNSRLLHRPYERGVELPYSFLVADAVITIRIANIRGLALYSPPPRSPCLCLCDVLCPDSVPEDMGFPHPSLSSSTCICIWRCHQNKLPLWRHRQSFLVGSTPMYVQFFPHLCSYRLSLGMYEVSPLCALQFNHYCRRTETDRPSCLSRSLTMR